MSRHSSLGWVAGEHTPAKIYITRVFNYGTWEEWQAMKRDFPSEQIREAIAYPLRGQWTPRGKAFAEVVFQCSMPVEAVISYDA